MYSGFSYGSRSSSPAETEIDDACAAWHAMEPHWILIEDLLKGTYGVRQKHRKYLPQEPSEQDVSYDARLARSTVAPFLQRMERLLAGMLVRKPVRLNDISDQVRENLFNVDMQGNDLNVWAFETAKIMLRYGHIGCLVDAGKDGGRPYWVTYSPREILGWRTELKDGEQKFSQLRLLENTVEPDGLYGEKEVEQVRLLTPGAYEIHRKNDKGEFVLHDEGTTSLSEIPFSVAYSQRVNWMESRPPLEDIAELNLKHYQIQSDLFNQLHISAVPMLAFFGFPQNSEEVTAGPGEAISFPPDGKAEFIEIKGTSFNAQFESLRMVEKQINDLGMAAILGTKLAAETAKSKEIDRSQGDSTMKVVAQQLQDLIDNSLLYHAKYLATNEVGTSFVNRDFLTTRLEPQEITSLQGLWSSGAITQETLLKQLVEGEVLGDDFDVEMELEAVAQDGLVEMEPPEDQIEEPEEEVELDE